MQNPVLSYLALGDSYTIGESVRQNERWPEQLRVLLQKEGINLEAPHLVAQTGWTATELSAGIAATTLTQQTHDLVSLMVGVNNQYRRHAIEQYQREFQVVLQTAIALANSNPKRVFVLSIPDWGVSPFAQNHDRPQIAQEIDAFNAVCRAVCSAHGVVFVDVTPLSRTALYDRSLIASDDLHFSKKMYAQWAAEVMPIIKKMIF